MHSLLFKPLSHMFWWIFITESESDRHPRVLSIRVGEIYLCLISINSITRFACREINFKLNWNLLGNYDWLCNGTIKLLKNSVSQSFKAWSIHKQAEKNCTIIQIVTHCFTPLRKSDFFQNIAQLFCIIRYCKVFNFSEK